MDVLRTPDDRFESLPGYPFAPNYVHIDGGDGGELRVHYVAEGPADGEIVLCLHGQPSWSYLYRKMIPPLASAGYRVIAPDLVGFGRSDKPSNPDDYTYENHVRWMKEFVVGLDLRRITMMCQDWGGLIGLRLLADMPERFARVVAANTGLPDGSRIPADRVPAIRAMFAATPGLPAEEMDRQVRANEHGLGFRYWIKHCAEDPTFRISEVIGLYTTRPLSEAELAAYDAPFPSEEYKQGARRFPSLVPILPDTPGADANRDAWEVLKRFERPFMTAFSDGDPFTRGQDARFRELIPGARDQPHVTIEGAGHFLQEDAPEQLADTIVRFAAASPLGA
ncbi:MAG: haloalkane dehalogenase [Dehalococcoidia bacterium]